MKPLVDPGPGQVRIRVEASGVCHSDAGTVEGFFPISWPRVPGHEIVGRIDALRSGVRGWAVRSTRRTIRRSNRAAEAVSRLISLLIEKK
jgi:NADPH:quinone reductase-like Zn-dependent oxidoreductase